MAKHLEQLLIKFIERATSEKATPEEIAILPEVVRVYLATCDTFFPVLGDE